MESAGCGVSAYLRFPDRRTQTSQGVQVGAAYLVVARLAVQAMSIGFPAFDAPPSALRVFILIALIGFPIAVIGQR